MDASDDAMISALKAHELDALELTPFERTIADVTPEGDARTKGFTWMQTISGFWGVMAYLIGAFIAMAGLGILACPFLPAAITTLIYMLRPEVRAAFATYNDRMAQWTA